MCMYSRFGKRSSRMPFHCYGKYGMVHVTISTSTSMHQSTQSLCKIEGCKSRQGKGKDYCWKHVKEHTVRTAIPTNIVSSCCQKPCTKGERHEYGERYCSRCEQPCAWRLPVK